MTERVDQLHHDNAPAHSTVLMQVFFLAKHHITQVCQPPLPSYSQVLLSQRRLTADWLAPRENDCLRMNSKVSSNWLPSYIKATRPVLEIFKMAGYFPDSPRKCFCHLRWTVKQCFFCILSFGWFPDVWIVCAGFSEHYLLHVHKRCKLVPPMKMEQCSETSARKIHSRGVTQKKEYNIQNTENVWNQEYFVLS